VQGLAWLPPTAGTPTDVVTLALREPGPPSRAAQSPQPSCPWCVVFVPSSGPKVRAKSQHVPPPPRTPTPPPVPVAAGVFSKSWGEGGVQGRKAPSDLGVSLSHASVGRQRLSSCPRVSTEPPRNDKRGSGSLHKDEAQGEMPPSLPTPCIPYPSHEKQHPIRVRTANRFALEGPSPRSQPGSTRHTIPPGRGGVEDQSPKA